VLKRGSGKKSFGMKTPWQKRWLEIRNYPKKSPSSNVTATEGPSSSSSVLVLLWFDGPQLCSFKKAVNLKGAAAIPSTAHARGCPDGWFPVSLVLNGGGSGKGGSESAELELATECIILRQRFLDALEVDDDDDDMHRADDADAYTAVIEAHTTGHTTDDRYAMTKMQSHVASAGNADGIRHPCDGLGPRARAHWVTISGGSVLQRLPLGVGMASQSRYLVCRAGRAVLYLGRDIRHEKTKYVRIRGVKTWM
jgi:hypothetical protein